MTVRKLTPLAEAFLKGIGATGASLRTAWTKARNRIADGTRPTSEQRNPNETVRFTVTVARMGGFFQRIVELPRHQLDYIHDAWRNHHLNPAAAAAATALYEQASTLVPDHHMNRRYADWRAARQDAWGERHEQHIRSAVEDLRERNRVAGMTGPAAEQSERRFEMRMRIGGPRPPGEQFKI